MIVVYAAIMGIAWKLAGTDYETVGLTADNAFAGIVLAVGAAALFIALTLALGTLFVGFGEEMTTRGVGVVALRGGMGEVGVWFVSPLLFGLLHSMNVLFGQSA